MGISGTAHLIAPQLLEAVHILVPAARHQHIVRKNITSVVKNYTNVTPQQLWAWQTDPDMEHLKLQCMMEKVMEPQYMALRDSCSNGFRTSGTFHHKYYTMYQKQPDGTIRRGADVNAEVSDAVGIPRSHDRYTPDDLRTADNREEGTPYRIPDMMARLMLRRSPSNLLLNRPGPAGQGRYNAGNRQSSGTNANVISIGGQSPLVVARQANPRRRELALTLGKLGDFTEETTTATLEDEKETVSVEPNTLDEVTELVHIMQKQLKLRPLTAITDLRTALKPFKFKVHLENPAISLNHYRTPDFPYDVKKLNSLSPVFIRRTPRNFQYNSAARFCNYVTSYDQFKCYMLA